MSLDETDLSEFPLDVGRLIFEHIAMDLVINDRPASLKLPLVSRQVKEWTEPFLYKSLVFDQKTRRVQRLLWTLKNSVTKPSEFYAMHVKFVVVTYFCEIDAQDVSLILSKCSGVKSLCMWFLDYDVHYPEATILPLTTLRALNINVWSPLFPAIEKLQGLTHLKLDFWDTASISQWEHWKALSKLKTLTHLNVSILSSVRTGRAIIDVVRLCQDHIPTSCEILLLQTSQIGDFDMRGFFELLNRTDEDRIVVFLRGGGDGIIYQPLHSPKHVEYLWPERCQKVVKFENGNDVAEWDGTKFACGQKDFWDVGLEVLQRARNGLKASD